MKKTWMITGASRGLGVEMARAALGAGDNVIAAVRNVEEAQRTYSENQERLLIVPLDVVDPTAAETAVATAMKHFGRIDALVNNAGYSQLGILEECSEEEIMNQLQTNVFGLLRVTRAVLPVMRKQRSGLVFNLSSIAGTVPYDLCTLYGMSKFAVNGFSLNLAREVEPFGIRVTLVELGYFRTDFLNARSARYSDGEIAEYASYRDQARARYDAYNQKQPGDPAKFGAAMLKLAAYPNPPNRILLGSDSVVEVRKSYETRLEEIGAWEATSVSTDIVPAPFIIPIPVS
jgi:NAD(P)-dependent dehydrogenase (short-subunit alcohol dehydrogenase family)